MILLLISLLKEKDPMIDNHYFSLAIVFGIGSFVPFLFDTILFAIQPGNTIRIFFLALTFVNLCFFYYFLYRHYDAIANPRPPKLPNSILISVLVVEVVLVIFLVTGFYPTFAQTVVAIFPLEPVEKLFTNFNTRPELIQPRSDTIISLLGQIFGVSTLSLILASIYSNELIPLRKSTLLELITFFIILLTECLTLVNNILLSFSLYSLDLLGEIIIIIILFIFLIALILLTINYIIFNQSHFLSPSIINENLTKLNNFYDKTNVQPNLPKNISLQDIEVVKKLSTVSIIILLYILNSSKDGTYANKIQTDLDLPKATISYTINNLEQHSLIQRFEILSSENLRLKNIQITQEGQDLLLKYYFYISNLVNF